MPRAREDVIRQPLWCVEAEWESLKERGIYVYIYIYICIWRERERER